MNIAIKDGSGVCGINKEPIIPNIYFLSRFSQICFVILCLCGVAVSAIPILKLVVCKNKKRQYLHKG